MYLGKVIFYYLEESALRLPTFCPGWCGSVDWAQACEPKGRWLDSQSGHVPGLRSRCPVRGVWEATTHWCFSHSPFPSLKEKGFPTFPFSIVLFSFLNIISLLFSLFFPLGNVHFSYTLSFCCPNILTPFFYFLYFCLHTSEWFLLMYLAFYGDFLQLCPICSVTF